MPRNEPTHSNGIAAVLSFLIPGMGHLYKGRIFGGLIWFAMAVVGYAMFIVPGVVVHILCVFRSAMIRPK